MRHAFPRKGAGTHRCTHMPACAHAHTHTTHFTRGRNKIVQTVIPWLFQVQFSQCFLSSRGAPESWSLNEKCLRSRNAVSETALLLLYLQVKGMPADLRFLDGLKGHIKVKWTKWFRKLCLAKNKTKQNNQQKPNPENTSYGFYAGRWKSKMMT